jgi:hypothetical protein
LDAVARVRGVGVHGHWAVEGRSLAARGQAQQIYLSRARLIAEPLRVRSHDLTSYM